ncbi:hypothetical protein BDR05DRAFT_237615 [Suillus weaverae]|nr:hypothetical protein BDR05DRAFT_237615 [Suillus weaverae]
MTVKVAHTSDTTDDSLHKIPPFIIQSISQLHHLHTLSVWDLGHKGMECLMQLRALQSLSLDLTASSSWGTLPQVQFLAFQDLTSLNLSTRTVQHASNFFRSLQIVRSREINIDFTSLPPGLPASRSTILSQFLAILQERCDNDKLESFSLNQPGKKSMQSSIFTSLHAFRNLTQLVIRVGCNSSMSDEELCQLVRAWPKLQVLKLSSYNTIIILPTFHGLIGLLRLCPALTSLSLAIDATELDGIDLKCPGGGALQQASQIPRPRNTTH